MRALPEHFRGKEFITDHFDTENRVMDGALILWAVAIAMGDGVNWCVLGPGGLAFPGQVDCFCFYLAHSLLLNGCKSVRCYFVPGPVEGFSVHLARNALQESDTNSTGHK